MKNMSTYFFTMFQMELLSTSSCFLWRGTWLALNQNQYSSKANGWFLIVTLLCALSCVNMSFACVSAYIHASCMCATLWNHSCAFCNPGQWVARKSVRSVTPRWEREQPWSSSPSGSVIIWPVLRWELGSCPHPPPPPSWSTSADPQALTWSHLSFYD